MDREQYEKDLRERQRKHLEQVRKNTEVPWQPCMHDACTSCHGTGIDINGNQCVHSLTCSCPKCSPH